MQTSIEGLILARVIQGIAGGLLTPMAQMMLARAAGRHLSRVIGYIAMPILIAPLLGPVVAGLILKHAGWPWLFYMNLPFDVLAVLLAMLLLPDEETPGVSHPFDFSGFVLLSPGIAGVLYGLDHAAQRGGRLFLILGVILIGSFIRHAIRKGEAALIDLQLFANRLFSIGTATQFFSNGANYAGQMLVPLFLITARGMSPAKAGWMLASMGIEFAQPSSVSTSQDDGPFMDWLAPAIHEVTSFVVYSGISHLFRTYIWKAVDAADPGFGGIAV
jgi:MFS family permease